MFDSQEYTAVKGTKISLIKPEGFTEADNFSGFEQVQTGSSIMVTEMPAAYSKVAPAFSAENLQSRGMTLLSKEELPIDDYPGQLFRVTQVVNSIPFVKWIAIFGDETETILIAATMPQELEDSLSETLKDSVLSAKWHKGLAVNPFADLNFQVDIIAPLKFTQRIQNTLLYTQDGVIPAKSPEDPLFVVGQAISDIAVTDEKLFSENRITQTAQVTNLLIESSREISINGLQGYEIIAKANDLQTNTPLVIYQVILFEKQTYYIMQGMVGARLRSVYLDEIQQMARSFRKK